MKIVHYKRKLATGMQTRLAVFFNTSTLIDVEFVWRAFFEMKGYNNPAYKASVLAPSLLSQLLQVQDRPIEFFQESLEHFKTLSLKGILQTENGADISVDMQDHASMSLGLPVDKINCYRDFYTHEKHVKTGFEKRGTPVPPEWYEIPVYYKSNTQGFIAHGDFILWPSFTEKLDYELELAAVIGVKGRNIKAEKVYEHILGFTILNDISARDLQRKEMKVFLGPSKSKDFCTVIGPAIITADEFNYTDPDLLMTARINGTEWSRGRSSESYYSWGEMLEYASQDEWMMPTDLCGSGTVGTGCGLELDRWIQPGDLLELEVEKIGCLKNIVGIPQKK